MLGEKIEYHWNYVRDRPGLQSRLKYTILLFYSIQTANIKNCFFILLYCTWIHVTFVVERVSWLKIVFNRTIYNINTMKSICQSRNKYLQDIKNFNYFRISFHPQTWLGVTVMPDVRIPEREERRPPRQCNSQKEKFIADSSQGSCRIQRSGVGSESPKPKLLHKFIGWAHAVGSWFKQIAKQFHWSKLSWEVGGFHPILNWQTAVSVKLIQVAW